MIFESNCAPTELCMAFVDGLVHNCFFFKFKKMKWNESSLFSASSTIQKPKTEKKEAKKQWKHVFVLENEYQYIYKLLIYRFGSSFVLLGSVRRCTIQSDSIKMKRIACLRLSRAHAKRHNKRIRRHRMCRMTVRHSKWFTMPMQSGLASNTSHSVQRNAWRLFFFFSHFVFFFCIQFKRPSCNCQYQSGRVSFTCHRSRLS